MTAHEGDAQGAIALDDDVVHPQRRDAYVIRSLTEEVITSSLLEGAAVTREVAKEMLRTSRLPRDKHERMILNNFQAMQTVRQWQDDPVTPARVLELHRIVTEGTLEDARGAGRLRTTNDVQIEWDRDETVLPPSTHGRSCTRKRTRET